MPITDFLDLMPATVTHQAVTGYDAFGKPTHSAPGAEYRARVSYRTKLVPNQRAVGQDVLATPQVWIAGVIPNLNLDDLIVLPDGSKPIMVNFDLPTDESGNHHHKLYFSGSYE